MTNRLTAVIGLLFLSAMASACRGGSSSAAPDGGAGDSGVCRDPQLVGDWGVSYNFTRANMDYASTTRLNFGAAGRLEAETSTSLTSFPDCTATSRVLGTWTGCGGAITFNYESGTALSEGCAGAPPARDYSTAEIDAQNANARGTTYRFDGTSLVIETPNAPQQLPPLSRAR